MQIRTVDLNTLEVQSNGETFYVLLEPHINFQLKKVKQKENVPLGRGLQIFRKIPEGIWNVVDEDFEIFYEIERKKDQIVFKNILPLGVLKSSANYSIQGIKLIKN